MPMTRRPEAVPSWVNSRLQRRWKETPEPERHWLRTYVRTLVARHGAPRDEVEWEHVTLTAEIAWTAREASSAALTEG